MRKRARERQKREEREKPRATVTDINCKKERRETVRTATAQHNYRNKTAIHDGLSLLAMSSRGRRRCK
jgi:hypothetical protein